jgi:hypothetical protein
MDEHHELGQIHRVSRTLNETAMRFRVLLLLAVVVLASACPRAGFLPAREVGPGEAARLAVGHSAAIRGTGVRLRLDAISDSRCPADVRCISAGDATAVLTFTGAAAVRTDTVHLLREPRATSYGGYRIELMDIQPAPRSAQDSGPKEATIAIAPA